MYFPKWTYMNFAEWVPKVQINNIPALVQIMACRRPGDKPFSEPIMVSLLTHIYVTQPQWVNRSTWVIEFICLYPGLSHWTPTPPHPSTTPTRTPNPYLNSVSNNLTKRESLICVTQRQWKTHRTTYINVYVIIHILREMKYQYAWGGWCLSQANLFS